MQSIPGNILPVLFGELYGPLRDLTLFDQVRLDSELHHLIWPNGADFDPWMLHEWPKVAKNLAHQAQRWEAELEPVA